MKWDQDWERNRDCKQWVRVWETEFERSEIKIEWETEIERETLRLRKKPRLREGETEMEIFHGELGSTLSAPAPAKYSFV